MAYSAVVLAAGASTRLGKPKALASLRGVPAVTRVCRVLYECGVEDVAVVLGADADRIAPAVPLPARVVRNAAWARGRTGSIKMGLRALPPGSATLVWPVDHPAIRTPTIQALLAAKGDLRIPTTEGQRGHPTLFAASLHEEILALRDDQPLHDVVHAHADLVRQVSVDDPGILLNLDTPDDLKKLDALLEKPADARPPP